MKLHHSIPLGFALVLAGCLDWGEKSGEEGTHSGETGLAIAVAANTGGETDVDKMRYSINRVACEDGDKIDALSRTITVKLESMKLPGGISAFENSPLDAGSEHPFADHFEVLPAGCYNIDAVPLAKGGEVSADCAPAWAKGISVEDGETTEVFLISQCKGAAVGALDTVVALNQPPTLEQVTYKPSKFISVGDKETICVTASDLNGDTIEFAWTNVGPVCDAPIVSSNERIGNSVTQCVELTATMAGSFMFEVKIYDLLHLESGALLRFEQWLRDHGYPNDSHDSLRLPLYVAASVGVEPLPEPPPPIQP
jgi:hypothetical protein